MFPGILVTRKYLMFAAAKEDNGKKEHYFVGTLTNSRAQMAKMLRVTLWTLRYVQTSRYGRTLCTYGRKDVEVEILF